MQFESSKDGTGVQQKAVLRRGSNEAPAQRGGGRAPRQRPACTANDACSNNEATPPAVAGRVGDKQDKTDNTEPSKAVFEPKTGANQTREEIDGVSATPPGSGPPASRMDTATALGAQPGMPCPIGETHPLRVPSTVQRWNSIANEAHTVQSHSITTLSSTDAQEDGA